MPDWRRSAPPEGRELATAISDSCIRKSSFSPNRGGIVYSGIAIGNRVLEGALLLVLAAGGVEAAGAQTAPAQSDSRIYEIVDAVSPERLEKDIRTLVGFGTRSTVSDTLSDTRGIGAARRWIKSEMDAISAACGGCLEVSFEGARVPGNESGRIRQDTWVVNVMAIQRGTEHPNRYVIMSGDIDSRPSDASDGVTDSPGANDNASGMAGVIEAARVLTRYTFPSSIVYLGLSGEEQGLFGGQHIAGLAVEQGWDIVPGVRIMETHEYYPRQHQDVRVEDGTEYGDVIEGVNFEYAAKLTAVNAATMASIAWGPPAPTNVAIGGAVRASAFLVWERVQHPNLAGYKVYWRDTTAPRWQHSRFVGDVGEYTFEGLVIDNYLFGVASVAEDGNESPVVFPSGVAPRR